MPGLTLPQATTIVETALRKARDTGCGHLKAFNPQQQPFFAALAAVSDGRVVPVPGGVLIRDAGRAIVGAVGISGDVSDKDEACAVPGVNWDTQTRIEALAQRGSDSGSGHSAHP